MTWYKDAVFYELHVKAFADADGNGVGDFAGLTSKLDYVRDLGVEGVLARLGMASVRIWARARETRRSKARAALSGVEPRRVLLVGAGEAGTHIGWEIRRRPTSGLFRHRSPRARRGPSTGR